MTLKKPKKKMDPLGDVEDDYELSESVITQGKEVDTYELAGEKEMVLADRLKKKKRKQSGSLDSAVTFQVNVWAGTLRSVTSVEPRRLRLGPRYPRLWLVPDLVPWRPRPPSYRWRV